MKYGIEMPLTGIVYVEVEADSEEEALEKFYETDITTDDITEWDTTKHVAEGNVCHAMLNSYDISLLDET